MPSDVMTRASVPRNNPRLRNHDGSFGVATCGVTGDSVVGVPSCSVSVEVALKPPRQRLCSRTSGRDHSNATGSLCVVKAELERIRSTVK